MDQMYRCPTCGHTDSDFNLIAKHIVCNHELEKIAVLIPKELNPETGKMKYSRVQFDISTLQVRNLYESGKAVFFDIENVKVHVKQAEGDKDKSTNSSLHEQTFEDIMISLLPQLKEKLVSMGRLEAFLCNCEAFVAGQLDSNKLCFGTPTQINFGSLGVPHFGPLLHK